MIDSSGHLKKKLIILLNLSGSYKGGAQRRYLNLFNYLQQINRDDYYLLLNDTLYDSCMTDRILIDSKNVLSISINYGRKKYPDTKELQITKKNNFSATISQRSKTYNFLGSVSSFLKQAKGWTGYALKLRKIIKKYNISGIYGVFTGGVWTWPIARLMNIKLIYSYNDSAASMIDRSILKILNSEYYTLKFADKVDFLSEGVLKKLDEKGVTISETRTLITPNSFILYDNFVPEYPKSNWVVFSARMTTQKNPLMILDAVSILKNRGYKDFSVYFLGEGILLSELIKKKDELKLDNIYFEGGISDTAAYLKRSKIFLSLQKDNNYPSQSLLEAMACENAIIASDVGETRKLVSEKEGILVELDTIKIADALIFLLLNPDVCSGLGKNARKKALEEHNIKKYSQYFFSITDN